MTQRILVTGAASGFGAALVRRLTARGDHVLVTDLADNHPVPDGASYQRLDVTSPQDWDRARQWVLDTMGGLDVLINNAGVATGGRIDFVPHDEWHRVMNINVLGVANGCRTFASMFKAAGSGHVVNTASLAGLVHPPAMASYTATKAAVVALSESLRYELAPHGVHVSVICPSFFRTNLSSSLDDSDPVMTKVARKLIDTADLDADQVAGTALAGIDAHKFLILTDRAGRQAYWTKRLLRPVYDRRMFAIGRRIDTSPDHSTTRKKTDR
ncbi:SDR family NAD(P)-dependent oxidoreductase [Rhodococcus tibetensis]|uniref:SDR family NAD(P)-dependent oxidoreductase n=1 Tax=Rhodococcus tibetensis TaxID=2965064 RepID=A0ABT1QI03_9NOCA|nr:SDR family NAD(P)-dependent oxidoreductase [Rhodococcus sp. FXJ9.536]MCQ4121871.1 SDR family NAD(P)-dependent oxidoreductase [Rhodococcus sp. FXJ9.536]